MINLKNSFRFIIKSPFQNFIVLLAVIVSIGVQFFILSLGSIMDFMILDQTTSYQDHIIVEDYIQENNNYNELNFKILKDIKDLDNNIKHVNYFLQIKGNITEINNKPISPSIILNFHAYDDIQNNDSYLNYTGLDLEKHLIGNSKIASSNKNEIMIDVTYAKNNNINIGDIIKYKEQNTNNYYEFLIVGIYDLGIFRKENNFTFTNLEKFNNPSSENFSINIQLNNTNYTKSSLNKVENYFENRNIKTSTWEDAMPEVSLLNIAQKAVVLAIDVFISLAFFIVILSILNFSIKQKYPQFGILKSLGQTNSDIRKTLTLQTLVISLLGATIGLISGTIAIKTYGRLMTYPDGTSRFIVTLSFKNYFIPSLLTITSAMLASIVSYLKIKKLSIVELIKEK